MLAMHHSNGVLRSEYFFPGLCSSMHPRYLAAELRVQLALPQRPVRPLTATVPLQPSAQRPDLHQPAVRCRALAPA